MFASDSQFRIQPCPDCGAPVSEEEGSAHRCEQRRFVEYQLLLLRPEVLTFENELSDWLGTPQGRFAAYYAERDRLIAAA